MLIQPVRLRKAPAAALWLIVAAAAQDVSGLSYEQARDELALVGAVYDRGRPGLASFRNVQDTTNDPVIAQRAPLPYRQYQASEDYYDAGAMIWLEVDSQLRALSGGKKSIDTFGKDFFVRLCYGMALEEGGDGDMADRGAEGLLIGPGDASGVLVGS